MFSGLFLCFCLRKIWLGGLLYLILPSCLADFEILTFISMPDCRLFKKFGLD